MLLTVLVSLSRGGGVRGGATQSLWRGSVCVLVFGIGSGRKFRCTYRNIVSVYRNIAYLCLSKDQLGVSEYRFDVSAYRFDKINFSMRRNIDISKGMLTRVYILQGTR